MPNNVNDNKWFPLSPYCGVFTGVFPISMLRTFIHGKIHGVRVTACKPRYNGSAEIDKSLLAASGIAPFEQIQIVNMTTGARLVTYAFPGKTGDFTLNGGAARLGEVGDECLVISYRQEEKFSGAEVVFVNGKDNTISETMHYRAEGEKKTDEQESREV